VIAQTISSVVVLTTAYTVARQPATSYVGILPLIATSFTVLRLMRRVPALLHRVADEATARVREAEVLNQELRRQIADRAEQLANALARLQTPSPSRALHPGMVLEDRYRVVRAIGKGGMGAVYEVERIADGRKLALKVLTGEADHVSLARFAREAQIAAELNHANVVSVLDVDVSRSGMLFVVMELVAGGSLAAERRRYGDAAWAFPILRQIAAALTAMHARGIVHRDLKPSNVLLDVGTVKVADFGLVAVLERAQLVETLAPDLTRTGAIMGTPLYMAPELARGAREANPSSDVFSFGVVAYELLANMLPFAAPPVLERLDGRTAPSAKLLAHTRPDLTREVCALVDGCLADQPETRPTADTLLAALERVAPRALATSR
jgi:serine/threonine-protein kinase